MHAVLMNMNMRKLLCERRYDEGSSRGNRARVKEREREVRDGSLTLTRSFFFLSYLSFFPPKLDPMTYQDLPGKRRISVQMSGEMARVA